MIPSQGIDEFEIREHELEMNERTYIQQLSSNENNMAK